VSSTKYGIVMGVIIVLGFGLLYSLYSFLESDLDEGLYFCEKENCYWAPGDMHASVTIKICGQEVPLPKNFGSDQEVHTHREKNVLHFEYRLAANIETKKILDTSPLQLGTFFRKANITFNENCLGSTCNGMLCAGKKAELYMLVNGKESSTFERYVWSDKDRIEINFEAVESEDYE